MSIPTRQVKSSPIVRDRIHIVIVCGNQIPWLDYRNLLMLWSDRVYHCSMLQEEFGTGSVTELASIV